MKSGGNLHPAHVAENVLELLKNKGGLELQEISKSIGIDKQKLLEVIKFLLMVGYVELRLSPSGREHLRLPKP